MRYLVSDTKIDHAGHFGMNDYSYNMLMKMMSAPNGIIYITGPTGSGKTTTLYMVLQRLAERPVNISTIEDPVEKDLPNITQTSVKCDCRHDLCRGTACFAPSGPGYHHDR